LSTWPLLKEASALSTYPRVNVIGIPSLDELPLPIPQSEEDKQLQDELEMLVERLGVSHDAYLG
jgi:hypothetical protein